MRNFVFPLLFALAPLLAAMPQVQVGTVAPPPLPEPFRLEDAIELSGAAHPKVRRAQAERALAGVERLEAEADQGFTADARIQGRYIEPNAAAGDQSRNDSSVTLSLRQPLYDFGRAETALQAAETEYQARDVEVEQVGIEQRLEVLRRYFDVVEADLAFNVVNEGMAIAFIRWDRLTDRNELGQVSDIDVSEAHAAFNRLRAAVRAAATRQRSARALLANALNRPGALPSTVEAPELRGNARALEEFPLLLAAAQRHNPELRVLRGRLAAAEYRLQAALASSRPTLSAQFDAGAWNRELGGRDAWAAGLVLDIPLFTGGRRDARTERRRAERDRLQADLDAARLDIRQRLLEAWLAVDVARVRVEEAQVTLDYRDLYLDRSRALYELEAQADLGDAMTRWSEARLAQAEVDHALAMALARLDALTGAPVFERLQGVGAVAVDAVAK